jgi:hypothetical protein
MRYLAAAKNRPDMTKMPADIKNPPGIPPGKNDVDNTELSWAGAAFWNHPTLGKIKLTI